MDEWLRSRLVCPRDKQALDLSKNKLICPENHLYPVFDDIPVMLVDDVEITHEYINQTLEKLSKSKKDKTANQVSHSGAKDKFEIDEFVQGEIPCTSGNLYFSIQHKLTRYPIPEYRLPEGNGERLLDIGCNWGRWTIAAAQKGYQPVGIDPSLDAVLAARRVSRQFGVETNFVVGDARFLPFADDTFDAFFSYGVFQHFSKDNVKISLDEAIRVLKKDGKVLVQMPNKFGVRQFYHYWRRGFTEGKDFEIRYWTPLELVKMFEEKFGDTSMTADCYFGLGIQKSDADLLPMSHKIVVYSSEILRKISKVFSPMVKMADSVYLESKNRKK